jgi:hypothetical protein
LHWTHPKKGLRKVVLSQSWIPRITQAIIATVGNENTFADFLMNNFGVAMVSDLRVLQQWKYEPVHCHLDEQTRILSFRRWNETVFHTVQLIFPKTGMYITLIDKKDLVKRLISSDLVIRAQAEEDFRQGYV